MIPSIDTNILVYSLDARDPAKQRVAQDVVREVRNRGGILALQACGEFFRAATRRLGQTPWAASQATRNWLHAFPIFAASIQSMERALTETATGRLSFWDANLLSAAEMAGCTHFFSEDMASGARLGRLEVVRPFDGAEPSEPVRRLLGL